MRRPSKRVAIAIAAGLGVVLVGAGVLAFRNYASHPVSGTVSSIRPTATATPSATESLVTQPTVSATSTPIASCSPTSNPTAVASGQGNPTLLGIGASPMGYDWGHGYPLLLSTDMQAGGIATWKWDGAGWVRLQPEQPPPFVPQAGPVYDPRVNQTVVISGQGMFGWNGSTWSDLHVTSPSNCGGQLYLA